MDVATKSRYELWRSGWMDESTNEWTSQAAVRFSFKTKQQSSKRQKLQFLKHPLEAGQPTWR